jgi:hypothetical protein
MTATTTPPAANRRTRRRLMAVGAVAAGLSVVVGGAGAAMAVAPTSSLSRAVASALHEAGVDWSSMPAGYTQAQYEAFWGAGYTAADVATLSALWKSDATETKAHAGQMILDGSALPIAPSVAEAPAPGSTVDYTKAQQDAFWGAGYTDVDVQKLNALWNSDTTETKAHAGQLILDGKTLPVAPTGTPTTRAAS